MMTKNSLNLLLADDDMDDCFFFKTALGGLPISTELITVNDGVQLMELLSVTETQLPDALFLDLNMPRKSGFECLSEIKVIDKLKDLPVIIFSTSLDIDVVNLLYEKGANYYIRKPGDFDILKKVIFEAVTLTSQSKLTQPERDKFILHP
ncbi:response regulator [Algoriphagus sp. C2-6-M1]|uniref:response regulator n=1 Tax=Algoriphagus persicinus TaxID=3108754 RepID=UPI002B3E2907|nr:response regulator [Algoriphagus sp. C2-6-M1]MEB2782843.1 response regulator [Algoriphagus sp. C2-6-M1]